MHALQHLIGSLVRRTWLVALVAVLVCAAFAARAVAALVEASYLAPSLHGAVPAPRPTQAKPIRSTPDGTELVVRNMFCSTCDPVRGGPGPTDSFLPDAMLIATSIGSHGDARATVRVPASEAQGSFGTSQSSLPAALGLRNGDVLSEINGTHIQSANTLLELYARLDQLTVVEIEGTRAGNPLAIQLRLK